MFEKCTYFCLLSKIIDEILVTNDFFPPCINFFFFSLSPDAVCPDNLPDQLWYCLAMCISSGVAVFPDFLYDFVDYPLHKFLYSGKNNVHLLFVAFCWLFVMGRLLTERYA